MIHPSRKNNEHSIFLWARAPLEQLHVKFNVSPSLFLFFIDKFVIGVNMLLKKVEPYQNVAAVVSLSLQYNLSHSEVCRQCWCKHSSTLIINLLHLQQTRQTDSLTIKTRGIYFVLRDQLHHWDHSFYGRYSVNCQHWLSICGGA